MKRSICLLLLGLALVGCTVVVTPGSSSRWSMTMTNYANDNYTGLYLLRLSQTGTSFTGDAYRNQPGSHYATLRGSIDGDTLSFRMNLDESVGGGYMDVTATLEGDEFRGDYTSSHGAYGPVSGELVSSDVSPDLASGAN